MAPARGRAYIAAMGFKLEHRIGVPASSSLIWDVLSDLPRWSEWNPLYPEISGLLRIGLKLKVTEAFDGRDRKVLTPTVVDWVPNAQILWSVVEMGGMIKRLRYIEIESFNDEDTACILSNGEIWDGMVGARMGKRDRRKLRAGFEAFNAACAERVARVMAGLARADGDRGELRD